MHGLCKLKKRIFSSILLTGYKLSLIKFEFSQQENRVLFRIIVLYRILDK